MGRPAAVSIQRVGQWTEKTRALKKAELKTRKCLDRALKQEGEFLRKQVVQGVRKQAPGGKKFQKTSRNTRRTRRFKNFKGSKALIRTGDLVGSVKVVKKPLGVFVGILRTAKASNGQELVNIARIHEEGSRPITIKMTPKMRRFLFAMFGGRRRKRLIGPREGGVGIIVIRIPPRPIFKPVFAKFGKPAVIRPRFIARFQLCMGPEFGVPSSKPPR